MFSLIQLSSLELVGFPALVVVKRWICTSSAGWGLYAVILWCKKTGSQNSINTSFICSNTDKYFLILSTSL